MRRCGRRRPGSMPARSPSSKSFAPVWRATARPRWSFVQRVNREIALLRLKQLLDLPQDFDLELADALGDERLVPPPAFAASVVPLEMSLAVSDPAAASVAAPSDAAVPERTAVDEAEAAVRLREASLQLTEAQRKPSVALNSTYARLAYPSNLLPTFDRSNWSVGATLNVPVLTGGRQRGDEQVARAEARAGAAAAASRRKSWPSSTRGRPGPSFLRRGRRGRPAPGRFSRRRGPTRSPTCASGRACRRSSSCRTRGCCCSRRTPTGRRRRAICRSRARAWRCCPTCRSARPSRRGLQLVQPSLQAPSGAAAAGPSGCP